VMCQVELIGGLEKKNVKGGKAVLPHVHSILNEKGERRVKEWRSYLCRSTLSESVTGDVHAPILYVDQLTAT